MKPAVKAYNWIYNRDYNGPKNFVDPRMAIAWHIDWKRPLSREWTENPTPEPDNYNWAMASITPHECPIVKYQVIYRDYYRKIWLTVMLVETRMKIVDIKKWMRNRDSVAYWQHLNAPMVRQPRPLLWNRQRATELTIEENLYTRGYYENFRSKYFCDGTHAEFFNTRVGEARALLIQPDPVQDEQY